MQNTMLAGSVGSGTGAAKESPVCSVVLNKVSQGCNSRWWGVRRREMGRKEEESNERGKKKRQERNKAKRMRGILSFDFLFPLRG